MKYDQTDRTMTGVWIRLSREGMSLGDSDNPMPVSIRQARAWAARTDGRYDDDEDWNEIGPVECEGDPAWIALMDDWLLHSSFSYECFNATVPVEYWGSAKKAKDYAYRCALRHANDDLHNPSFNLGGSRLDRVKATAAMYGVQESDIEGGE